MIQNKRILLISPEPWDHIFVSKHHYATHLANHNNRVYFLNPPSNKKMTLRKTQFRNIFSIDYAGFPRGLRYLPNFFVRKLLKKKFTTLQKLCKTEFDIVWSFDNSVFFDFNALKSNVFCISHIVDLNQDFQFEKASKTADLCLASSMHILSKQKKYNSNSYNIGHGFNHIPSVTFQLNDRVFDSINCGYAGNMDIPYFNWELLESLLRQFPNINFYFAGTWKMINHYPNIYEKTNFHYIGILDSNRLQGFYKEMDILLLLYRYELYPEQLANPHKMMEYLGSGKPIIATWSDEYYELHQKGLISMNKSINEYLANFSSICSNLNEIASNKQTEARRAFALDNTYEKQIEKIQKIINGK